MPSKIPHLSDGQKVALARRHLSGETYGDLKGYAGLSHPQIRNLFSTQGMRDIMAAEKGYYDGVTARARLKLYMEAEPAADTIARLRRSSNDEMAFKASKFILESVLPTKASVLVETHHHIDASVIVQATETMSNILTLLRDREPGSIDRYTLHGTEGIETAEPSTATQLPKVAGPNGSGSQQDEEPDVEPEPSPTC